MCCNKFIPKFEIPQILYLIVILTIDLKFKLNTIIFYMLKQPILLPKFSQSFPISYFFVRFLRLDFDIIIDDLRNFLIELNFCCFPLEYEDFFLIESTGH